MRITLDTSIDIAYIYLAPVIGGAGVAKTYPCDPVEVGTLINLDFDAAGRLIGIEVMGASRHLSPEVLNMAEIIG